MPGTVLGSENIRKKRCNLCFHGAYSLQVKTDMQKKNLQHNKVLPWRYLQSAVGTRKREKEHLPGEIRESFTEEVATELRRPMIGNLPCRQAGKRNDRCEDTEAQGALWRSRLCSFSWAEGAMGRVAGWARQTGRYQIVKSLWAFSHLFNKHWLSAYYVPGSRLSAGIVTGTKTDTPLLSWSLHSSTEIDKKSINK